MTILLVVFNVIVVFLLIAILVNAAREQNRMQTRLERLTNQIENATDASAKIAEVQAFCHYARETLNEQIEHARHDRDKARANELLQLRNRVETLEARVVHRTIRLLDDANGSEKNRRKKHKAKHIAKKS